MSLKTDLNNWNGKHIDDLDEVYFKHSHKPAFIPGLIKLLDTPDEQRAVAWLIKQYCKEKAISPNHIKLIYSSLNKLIVWQSRIQILQVLPLMPIANAEKKLNKTRNRMSVYLKKHSK